MATRTVDFLRVISLPIRRPLSYASGRQPCAPLVRGPAGLRAGVSLPRRGSLQGGFPPRRGGLQGSPLPRQGGFSQGNTLPQAGEQTFARFPQPSPVPPVMGEIDRCSCCLLCPTKVPSKASQLDDASRAWLRALACANASPASWKEIVVQWPIWGEIRSVGGR